MTDQSASNGKPKSPYRMILRWLIVIVIFYFLGERLIRDWPSVQDAYGRISWGWIVLGLIPGFLYFIPRIASWRSLLRNLGVQTRFWQAGKVWVNGEIVRYIPGNVWSILGRIAQAGSIGTTRTVVFSSMVLEAILLGATCTMFSVIFLIGYGTWQFPGRTTLFLAVACASLFIAHRRIAQWFVSTIFRVLRRKDPTPVVPNMASAFAWMVVSWLFFGLFQLLITISLGISVTFWDGIALIGAFLFSWLLGYLSFITPSGLGVREAATVLLLRPYMGMPEAILVAIVSRVFIILVEVVGLGIVNLIAFRTRNSESTHSYGTQ
ncbi:MAG: lysylphosphatidylglycerol synthase transmembrane domain-containing protein [Candidatus Kerfeldbacteria bacterium]